MTLHVNSTISTPKQMHFWYFCTVVMITQKLAQNEAKNLRKKNMYLINIHNKLKQYPLKKSKYRKNLLDTFNKKLRSEVASKDVYLSSTLQLLKPHWSLQLLVYGSFLIYQSLNQSLILQLQQHMSVKQTLLNRKKQLNTNSARRHRARK